MDVSLTDNGGLSYTITEITSDSHDFNKVEFVLLDSNGNPTSSKYNMDISVVDSSSIQVTAPNSYLPAGTFKVLVHKERRGYSVVTPDTVTINFPATPTVGAPITTSFVGSKELVISGAGFADVAPENNDIRVCGMRAKVLAASQTEITIETPALVTESTQAAFQLAEEGLVSGIAISDIAGKGREVFDDSFNTIY